jgi:gamma-glutamyltranspeptidase
VRRDLAERGHRLGGDAFMGGYQAVARDGTGWAGATESRKDGCALGI